MRRFSVRPALTLRGRTFQGPRGWAGKPPTVGPRKTTKHSAVVQPAGRSVRS
ncbi:MAG: hypothetical protein ABR511_00890 [Acidimicrobiales bacterium]